MNLASYRTLGRSGLRVSPLALGAMNFDDGSWGSDESASFALLDRYREAGGNFVDTANMYSAGQSEQALGAYFAKHAGVRDRLVLATKFGGNMYPGDPNGGGAGRKAIREQVDASLGRLGTDYLDLYWQHQWDPHTPVEETLSTLNHLVQAGKIRYIGLSNTPAWFVAQAETTAMFRGWARVVALQVEYSLLERTVEGEILGVARQFGMGITPWSPLASGVLTGKYTRENATPEGSKRHTYAASHLTEATFTLLDALGRIAGELDTTVAAVSLAWLLAQPQVTPLIGPRTMAQFDDNVASLGVRLTDTHLAEIDALSKPRLNYPADVITHIGTAFQQGGTTINGLASQQFARQ